MQIKKISLRASIIPKAGIGDIKLGMNISCFYQVIKDDYNSFFKNWSYSFGENGIISIITLTYKQIIELYFNSGLGTLEVIKLKKGYKGELFNDIKIGSSCDKIFPKFDSQKWTVADGMLGFSPDLLFKIGEDDDYLEKEEVLTRKIEEIWLRDLSIINARVESWK